MNRVARPYAYALIGAAGSLDEVAQVRNELGEFLEMSREVPALSKMAVNPGVPLEVKQRILDEVVAGAGFSAITARFLTALLARHKLSRLDEILSGVTELLNERRGIAVAKVQSAEPLTDEAQQRLSSLLETKLGKEIELELAVDPDLLAGFVVRIGSNYYDASVKGQLDRLTADLARV